MSRVFPKAVVEARFGGAALGALVALSRWSGTDRETVQAMEDLLLDAFGELLTGDRRNPERYLSVAARAGRQGAERRALGHVMAAIPVVLDIASAAEAEAGRAIEDFASVSGLPWVPGVLRDVRCVVRELISLSELRSVQLLENSMTREAVRAVRTANGFEGGIDNVVAGTSSREAVVLGGVVAGACFTAAGIPSAWMSELPAPDRPAGLSTSFPALLRMMASGIAYAGGEAVGPYEVLPGLFLANLRAVASCGPEFAVHSLCRVDSKLAHARHREFLLNDVDRAILNPSAPFVLDDVLGSVEEFLATDVPVVIHCREGKSRTGLVLRAWLMWRCGLGEQEATEQARKLWPRTSTWNGYFTELLRGHRFERRRHVLPGHDLDDV